MRVNYALIYQAFAFPSDSLIFNKIHDDFINVMMTEWFNLILSSQSIHTHSVSELLNKETFIPRFVCHSPLSECFQKIEMQMGG